MQASDATRHRPLTVAALVGGLVLINAIFIAHFGLRMHGLAIYDEKFSVQGARWLHGGLHRLFETPVYGDRGIERLTSVLLVPALWLFGSTAQQFVFNHVLMSVLFALQAVPAFLIARGLGARLWWSLFAGAFAVFGPWAVFGTVFLNNTPGACFAAFALWAMWRAVVSPSPLWDGLAVLLIALTALSRVSYAALALALPIAIVTHAIVVGRQGRSVGRTVGDLLRAHWLLVILGAVGLVVLLVKGTHAIVGGQYATVGVQFDSSLIGTRVMTSLAHLGAGTAVVATVVALAWIFRQVFRPLTPEAHAFAVLALVFFAALLWVNLASGIDERYELPLFVPLAVAFAVALARREVAVAPALIAGALCWWALRKQGDIGFTQTSDYLTWPSREWLSKVWLTKAQYNAHIDRKTAINLIGIAATLIAVGLALVRGRWSGPLRTVVAGVALVFAVLGGGWAMQKLTDAERPVATFDQMSFVDRVTGGARTDPVGSTTETNSAVPQGWNEVQFFNESVEHPISLEGKVYDLCCGVPGVDQVATIDHANGHATSPAPFPPYVATIPEWLPAGFASKVVAASSAYVPPVRVEKLRQPVMAAWLSSGFDYYGWARPKQKATLRVFPAAAPAPACLRATLQAPTGDKTISWQIRPAPGRRAIATSGSAGRLRDGTTKRVDIPLRGPGPIDLRVTASPAGPDTFLGQPGLVGLSDLHVVTCGEPDVVPTPNP